MRICFVSHTARLDGAELALLELLQGLSKLGIHCFVFVPKKGPLLIELDRRNIEWRVLTYPWWWKSRRKSFPHRVIRALISFVAAVRMAYIITQQRCDFVYTNTVAVSTGALAAWIARKPHIWHLHESPYRYPRLSFDLGNRLATRLIDRLSTVIIAVSHAIANDYSRYISQDKIHVIYQSVAVHSEPKDTC